MDSLIQQLANNESVLLMYLADELPPPDRAEVETMLANDPGLRRELEQLQEVHRKAMDALAALDAVDSMKIADATTIRRTSRVIRQWQADRAVAKVPQEEVPKLRYPWWAYPAVSVAAASVLLVFLLWWSSPSDERQLADQQPGDFSEYRNQRIADSIRLTLSAGEDPQKDDLANAEDELALLTQPGDDSAAPFVDPATHQ